MKVKLLFLLIFLFFHNHTIIAQEVTGDLAGRILDAEGTAVVAANISISGASMQGLRGTASNDEGYFRILALPVGYYMVTIHHLSFQEAHFENVSIRLGKTTTLQEIFLQSQVLEHEAIIISATRPAIDLATTSSGANLDADEYRNLPVQRNYQSIAALVPQATNSFLGDEVNFSGSTGLENKYFVDGVETTDPYLGTTGTNLPYNLIKEIEVRTGGYEAEYRSSLGGIINVITYSGGNEFHGQAFGFTNNQFSGSTRRPSLLKPKGDFVEYDFGLSLGGPVLHDKLWFYAAYNPKVEKEDVTIPGLGVFKDKSTTHIFAAKLTWQASARTNIVFSLFGDPKSRDAIGETPIPLPAPSSFENPDPYLMNINRGGISISLRGTYVLDDYVLIESSLSRISRSEKNKPATERGRNEPLFLDWTTGGTWSGGSSGLTDNLAIQTTFDIAATLLLKHHTLKTGLAYRDNRLKNESSFTIGDKRAPDNFSSLTAIERGTFHNRIPSLFIQDSWQINGRLRLNIGLRWDGQYLVGSNGKVAQKITDQYQPRVGLIYLLGEKGSQKLYGSFGRFYHDLALFLSTKHLNDSFTEQFTSYDHDFRIDPSGGITSSPNLGVIQPEVKDLEGQHYDEFNLGYERLLGQNLKVGSKGIYRTLRQGIEDAWVPDRTGQFIYGNPGKGDLDIFPEMKREYIALELTIEKFAGTFNFMASYVLSRNWGNYPGLFTSDIVPQPFPNANGAFNLLAGVAKGKGLLPNDRTHVFKFSGYYSFDFGLNAGTFFSWQTGKPKNEFGSNQSPEIRSNYFIQKRGAAGRLSSIWDLNLRFSYDLTYLTNSFGHSRLILDIFHLGSTRKAVAREEVHFFDVDGDGNPIAPNPNYNSPLFFQPAMAVKFGLEVGF